MVNTEKRMNLVRLVLAAGICILIIQVRQSHGQTNMASFENQACQRPVSRPGAGQTKESDPVPGQSSGTIVPHPLPDKDRYPDQPFFANFYPYKPIFFLFGAHPGVETSSFQVSFKYRFFNFDKKAGEKPVKRLLEKLFFAYTQQTFWDLKSDSMPFEDTRYMPELFFYYDSLDLKLPWLSGAGIQAGYQHESNGRDEEKSRSTNYAYIQPLFRFSLKNNLGLLVAPKVWCYVNNNNRKNPHMADYRGYFDLETRMGDPGGLILENHFGHGSKGGNWKLDLSCPLARLPWLQCDFDLYLHLQYISGYSEQLLRYDRREDVFRIGFSLIR